MLVGGSQLDGSVEYEQEGVRVCHQPAFFGASIEVVGEIFAVAVADLLV